MSPPTSAPPRPFTIRRLAAALRSTWTANTSATRTWASDRASSGQCAVTALVVQDFFGGTLLRGVVCGQSHYWNRLPDGTELDLTRDQFPDFVLDVAPEERSRSYVLSFADTERRYIDLRTAVRADLGLQRANTSYTALGAELAVSGTSRHAR